jgi:hypothetical protein
MQEKKTSKKKRKNLVTPSQKRIHKTPNILSNEAVAGVSLNPFRKPYLHPKIQANMSTSPPAAVPPAAVAPDVPEQQQPSQPMPAPAPTQYMPPAPAPSSSAPSASLYVGELDPTVSEAMLFEIFNMIGPVARYVRRDGLRITTHSPTRAAFVCVAML